MIVQEKNAKISAVLNKIFGYINTNLNLKKDLDDYYKATGISKDNTVAMNNYTLNYIFERRLGQEKRSIFDYALSDMNDLSEDEREIVNVFKNSINGVFEVKKLTHNSFELFNIVNEKTYQVVPMEKITKFKNLSVGHFLLARLLKYNNEYLLFHITDHVNYSNRITAFQIAVSRLAQDPSQFHFDNPEKLEELKAQSKDIEKKFKNLFEGNIVTTSNKLADKLVELLNDYIETNNQPSAEKVQNEIAPLENSSYFDISELKAQGNPFIEAKKGFSAHNKEYNVSLLSDEFSGLVVVPFMDIFLKVFEVEDYKSLNSYKECVKEFVQSSKIPPLALKIAFQQHQDNFISRVNEILETEFSNLDEILHKYKSFYLENPYTSSTTTLYSSYAFKKLIGTIEELEEANKRQEQKVGRNDPCPCGSGLKYKKCCGMAVQI